MAHISVNQGTAKNIATDTVGTIDYGIVKLDMGTIGGTNPFSGTLPEITNLAAGTITKLGQGSVNVTAGTMTAGTVDLVKAGTVTEIGTVLGIGGTVNVDIVGTEPIIVEVGTIAAGTINTGTINTGTIDLLKAGTITEIGTINGIGGTVMVDIAGTEPIIVEVGTIATGSINVTAGTGILTSGSVNVIAGTVNTGTIDILKAGTLTTIPNIPGGTLGLVTTITNLSNGTIQNSGTTTGVGVVSMLSAGTVTSVGTLPGVGVVSNLTNGSVRMTVGTVTVLPDLPGGTIDTITSVSNIVGGTITRLGQGSINVTAGTITTGSIIVTNGTIGAGTINIFDNLLPSAFNNISVDYTDGTTETYTYKTGTLPTGTITVVYLDEAKGSLSTVTRST